VPDGARRVRPAVDERRDGFFDMRAVRSHRAVAAGGGGGGGARTRGVGGSTSKEQLVERSRARRGRGKAAPPPPRAVEGPMTSMPPSAFFNPQFARLLQQNAALRHSVFAAAG